uniref:Uncharacterized protein n=1 Tax=Mycolicibacterium sp. CBMA 213 TaxID=1968788 RepID=A0A1S6GKJ6_9MYCO|nr:hypothetical protein [Mycolicibacterium sp. CBMA 213]AQS22388.1 hypothetical protein pCBMA213_2_00024 [Mycolicibacterium sp. CBMA 213]
MFWVDWLGIITKALFKAPLVEVSSQTRPQPQPQAKPATSTPSPKPRPRASSRPPQVPPKTAQASTKGAIAAERAELLKLLGLPPDSSLFGPPPRTKPSDSAFLVHSDYMKEEAPVYASQFTDSVLLDMLDRDVLRDPE